jgi:hypothetical protein
MRSAIGVLHLAQNTPCTSKVSNQAKELGHFAREPLILRMQLRPESVSPNGQLADLFSSQVSVV